MPLQVRTGPSRLEEKMVKERCNVMPAAKTGLLSSIKRRLGNRAGRSSASVDLGMSLPAEAGEPAAAAPAGGSSKPRMGPRHQMSLDATGRDAAPRGKPTVAPRTFSLNAGPSGAQLPSQQLPELPTSDTRQRFSAFGIGFMRTSKDKKKLNKSERSKKCNSSDSGIQLETSGGDYYSDVCGFSIYDLCSHDDSSGTAVNQNNNSLNGWQTLPRAQHPDASAVIAPGEPQHLPQYHASKRLGGLLPVDRQIPQRRQQAVRAECQNLECHESNNNNRNKRFCHNHGHNEATSRQDIDQCEDVLEDAGQLFDYGEEGTRAATGSGQRLRPEKLRKIKTSLLTSPHQLGNRSLLRRSYSDLIHQHKDKLLYISHKRRAPTARSYMSLSPAASTGGWSPQSTYVTRVDINGDGGQKEQNGHKQGEDDGTVQLRRGSCAAWGDKGRREAGVGSGHPLRRSLSQPLDVDRLKEALVVVRGTRALRLQHRAPTNHRHSSGGTTTPTTTPPTGTTSNSAASTTDDEDESSSSSDDDDSVSYRRRASLEDMANTSGESRLKENGGADREEDQVVVLAEAVFDHVTIEREELAFKAGDVIEVQQTSDRTWWWGSAGGNTGWFPADRVRLRVSQEDTFEDCIAALQSGNVAPTPLRRRTSISLLSNDQVRTSVIRELVHTERDFVKVLLDVSEGYMAECRKRSEMFTSCQIDTIFMNIEDILRFQTAFLKDLEQCIDWDAPHKSCVGECFLKHREGFTIYSLYCNGHTLASATLQELCQLNNYSKFFEACRLMRGLIEIPLHGYLLAPVQRICKYPLQLAELLKYTRSGHRDHRHVQQALAAMRDVAALINDRKRRMESLEKLQLWQQRVEGWQGPDLIDLSTQMICQGEAKRVSARRVTSSIILFLFDYQVIYCKKDILNRNTYTYKGRISLDTTEVIDLTDGKDLHVHMNVRHAIKLYSCVSDWFLLFCCRTRADKQRWLDAFKAERRLVEADRAARLHVDFLPGARHLARVAARCQAAHSVPRKPMDKDGGAYRTNGQLNQHSNSNSLGRRMGTWFTFGGNTKRKRYRPRDAH